MPLKNVKHAQKPSKALSRKSPRQVPRKSSRKSRWRKSAGVPKGSSLKIVGTVPGALSASLHGAVLEAKSLLTAAGKFKEFKGVVDRVRPRSSSEDKGYSFVEEKKVPPVNPLVDLLVSQLKAARGMVRGALGNRAFPLTLLLDASAPLFTVTVTSGVVAGVTTLLPSAYNEWASIAALFDEVKVNGVDLEFTYANAGAATANGLLVVAYDPSDVTALSSTVSGAVLAQHRLYGQPRNANAGIDLVSAATMPNGEPYRFSARVPPGIFELSGTSMVVGGLWTSTGAPGSYGFLKTYHVGRETTAVVAGSAISRLHCEFRCRE